MPSNKAVVDVIEQWSGQRPDKMSQGLEEWWNKTAPGSSHSALQFDHDGIEDLLQRLRKAFPSSPALQAADFQASGNIKTVQDLVDALQPTLAMAAAMNAPQMADIAAMATVQSSSAPVKRRSPPKKAARKRSTGRSSKKRKPAKTTRRSSARKNHSRVNRRKGKKKH